MKIPRVHRIGFDYEAPEKPPRMVAIDAYSAFVPLLERAARLARKEAERCRRAFLPTDMEHASRDAQAPETLAHHFDSRGGR